MLPYSPEAHTSRRVLSLGPHEPYILPYTTPSTKSRMLEDLESLPSPKFTPERSERPRESLSDRIARVYHAVSWIFGFREKYSLLLCACKSLMSPSAAYRSCSICLRGCPHWILSWTLYDDEP